MTKETLLAMANERDRCLERFEPNRTKELRAQAAAMPDAEPFCYLYKWACGHTSLRYEHWNGSGPLTAIPLYTHPASAADHTAAAIHYPACWDTAAYPTLESALSEMYHDFKCQEDHPPPDAPAREAGDASAERDTDLRRQLAEHANVIHLSFSTIKKQNEHIARLEAELAEVKAQLPEEMQDCTIVFKECSVGHGWLTATNWQPHECHICALTEAKENAEQAATIARLKEEIKAFQASWNTWVSGLGRTK